MEPAPLEKHEYRTLDIPWKQGFLAGLKAAALPDLMMSGKPVASFERRLAD